MANVNFTPIPKKEIEALFNKGLFAVKEQVLNDCNRYCKVDTGATRDSAEAELSNMELAIWWLTNYAVYAWFTGRPNRGNANTRSQGIADSGNPNAQLQWGEYAGRKHGREWALQIERVMNSG